MQVKCVETLRQSERNKTSVKRSERRETKEKCTMYVRERTYVCMVKEEDRHREHQGSENNKTTSVG